MNPNPYAGSLDVLVRRSDATVTVRRLRWARNNEAASDAAFREINSLVDSGWRRIDSIDRDGDEWTVDLVSPNAPALPPGEKGAK